jgi:hypothetical protein
MSLTTRLGKGSGTPFKEMDQNLLYLESLSSGVLLLIRFWGEGISGSSRSSGVSGISGLSGTSSPGGGKLVEQVELAVRLEQVHPEVLVEQGISGSSGKQSSPGAVLRNIRN